MTTVRPLIVEDNPADADLIREILPDRGPVNFQVESVSHLAQAISRLERGGIDIILLDLGLPDSQGLSTLTTIVRAVPDIAVVVMTGRDDAELALAALRGGAQDFLPKGTFDAALLQRSIRYAVERKRTEAALVMERQNLNALFASSPIALLLLDSTTTIVRVNAAAIALAGSSESEMVQHRPGNVLRCVHSAKDPRGCGFSAECPLCDVRNGLEGLIANGGSMHGVEVPMELIRNEVPIRTYMRLGAEPVLISGEPHLLVALDDITERKQAEASLEQQTEALRARNDVLTRFNRVAVGRELHMMELKRDVNALCGQLGQPPRFHLPDLQVDVPAALDIDG